MDNKVGQIVMVPLSKIKPNKKNNNVHTKEQKERAHKIFEAQGFRSPLLISNRTGTLVAGHLRLEVAKEKGVKELPCMYQDFKDEAEEYAHLTADNALASWSSLDLSMVNTEMLDLGPDFDIEMLGIKDFEILPEEKYEDGEARESLSKKFLVPPFSVFDTKQGYWQDRKKVWLKLGIESESGREENLLKFSKTVGEFTSIFDPVLAEIAYTWFCPKDGLILDCFSGGSVRGIVASHTGRQYIGVDLREEQVKANQAQEHIAADPKPVWKCGDSVNIKEICEGIEADMIFSCPPYADLEVYSKQENDLSNMDYDSFKEAYFKIIQNTCDLLKDDSFACFVIGEVRDKKGIYYNFVSDTIEAFSSAGLKYYNEIILLNSQGSAAMRANKIFNAGRKVVKTHQNVLVFVKGDPKEATKRCGQVEVMETENDA